MGKLNLSPRPVYHPLLLQYTFMKLLRLCILLAAMLPFYSAMAQISGIWARSFYDDPMSDFGMDLKGNVKSWTMTTYKGETRTMTFDQTGKLTSDTFKGTPQDFIPPDFMLIKLKNDLEKSHRESEKAEKGKRFNARMQMTEHRSESYLEENTFNNDGRILIHRQSYTREETRAWNSLHHSEPTYSFTTYTGVLAFFRYNEHGSLKEVEYFHSNSDHNVKKVYIYNEDNNLVETNRYDAYNIYTQDKPDEYLSDLLKQPIDTSFSIKKYYKNYWKQGHPSVCKWRYNDKGQKIAYDSYGYKHGLSSTITWEYDAAGKMIRELHHDVYVNKIRSILDFDSQGNVIKETNIDREGKEQVSNIAIVYY